jgi:hypothetical protein
MSAALVGLCRDVVDALRVECPAGCVLEVDPSVAEVVCIRGGRDLVVELVSADFGFRDLTERAQAYAATGLANYWVIDHSRPDLALTRLVLLPGQPTYLLAGHTTGVVTVEDPWPVTIDLPARSRERAATVG